MKVADEYDNKWLELLAYLRYLLAAVGVKRLTVASSRTLVAGPLHRFNAGDVYNARRGAGTGVGPVANN
ncbi:MAG: hypothetical protein EOO60_02100 [Hymenobacter sp.]|nr:MAG: hypothetical protein EOO60_02100 [Hymenobacter sp.]